VQYALKLPADLVWIHVMLAVLTWLAILWACAEAGSLEPRRAAAPAEAMRAPRRAEDAVSSPAR